MEPIAMHWGTQYHELQYNPLLPTGEANQFDPFSFADVSAGVVYWFSDSGNRTESDNTKYWRIGFLTHHLNGLRNANYKEENHQ